MQFVLVAYSCSVLFSVFKMEPVFLETHSDGKGFGKAYREDRKVFPCAFFLCVPVVSEVDGAVWATNVRLLGGNEAQRQRDAWATFGEANRKVKKSKASLAGSAAEKPDADTFVAWSFPKLISLSHLLHVAKDTFKGQQLQPIQNFLAIWHPMWQGKLVSGSWGRLLLRSPCFPQAALPQIWFLNQKHLLSLCVICEL